MMKTNKGLLLLIAFALLAGVAFLVSRQTEPTAAGAIKQGDPLITVDPAIIASVEVIGATTSRVISVDQKWVFPEVANYPADVDALRGFVHELMDAKVGSTVVGGTELLEELGLGDSATLVKLASADGEVLAELHLGDSREGQSAGPMGFAPSGGTYVRIQGGPVVLTDAPFVGLPSSSSSWMKRRLTALPPAEIESISVNDDVNLLVKGFSTFELPGIATNKQLNSTTAGQLARAFQFLDFKEVVTGTDSFEATTRIQVRGNDGIILNVDLGEENENGVLYRQSADYIEPSAPTPETVAQDVAEDAENRESKVAEALATALAAHQDNVDAAKKTVKELNAKSKWTFRISSNAARSMRQSMESLQEDIPELEQPVEE